MKITVEMLRKAHACSDQLDLFVATFGDSVDVTVENVRKAREVGVGVEWALRLLPAEKRRAYHEATATARRAYYEATATARRAYYEARDAARRAYDEATATARRAYHEATATARRAYDEATATAFVEAFK